MYHLRNKFKRNPWQKYLDMYRESGATVKEHTDEKILGTEFFYE
jgi:hypothetical protein